MIAVAGTPTIMPVKPKKLPNTNIAITTHRELMPIVLPRIFGPMIFPSSCYMTSTIIRKRMTLSGAAISSNRAPNMPPNMGPKVGMILVTPIITASRG